MNDFICTSERIIKEIKGLIEDQKSLNEVAEWAKEIQKNKNILKNSDQDSILYYLSLMNRGREYQYSRNELKLLIELISNDNESPMSLINEIRANRDFIDFSLPLNQIITMLPIEKKYVIKLTNEFGVKKINILLLDRLIVEIFQASKGDFKIKFFQFNKNPYLYFSYRELINLIESSIELFNK